ncbi:MAG: polysaccharide deacetylase family protein [Prosthecobacter sp.]|nr:polysaccharide deacetylase family protein [Prosthecobacter sp.]
MIPPPPARCRRQNGLALILSLLPAAVVFVFALRGQWREAVLVFGITFLIISWGTILPRVRLFGPSVSKLPPAQAREGGVWITIDDGPDPVTTPRLLDILDEHGVKAGFFLIGAKARLHPDLVREIARRGHLIGNHSQTHPVAHFWRLRPARMWQEIAGCQQTLTEILGVAPVWFRPPVGHHNLFIGPPLRALGLTMVMWNCRGFDGLSRNVPGILRRLARGLRPGAIILIHDGIPVAVAVLEGTLRLLEERELKPVLVAVNPA